MNRILITVALFCASTYIGRNIINGKTVQASPIVPNRMEFPILTLNANKEPTRELDTINIVYDKETQKVSVNGKDDIYVTVTTMGEQKPIIKWKTKIIEKESNTGYPYVKSIGRVPEDLKPAWIFDNEQFSSIKTNDTLILRN